MSHSMQCPKCDQTVTVADGSGGSRFQCPHCQHSFVIPGTAKVVNDDDDWLRLDEDAPSDDPTRADQDDDEFGLESDSDGNANSSLFDDLPELVPHAERPPPGPRTAVPVTGATAHTSGSPSKQSPPAAQPVEYESEYRVICPTCGTMIYAKAAQAGSQVACPDCYGKIKVPAPPRKATKLQIEPETADSYSFAAAKSTGVRADPFQKSAEALLADAEREEVEAPETNYDVPQITEWLKHNFGIFLQPAVLVYWLVLSVFGAIPMYIALRSELTVLLVAVFPFGIVFIALVTAICFAILHSVSNDEEVVDDWPELGDPGEWLGPVCVALAAVTLSAAPISVLCHFFSVPVMINVFLSMAAIYVLFPFVLLSMLDMQSVAAPFSPEVAKSVTRCDESWGVFYFTSGAVFALLFVVYVVTSLGSPATAALIDIPITIAAAFVYFAMLGRLAFRIGQSINDPSDEEEVDETNPVSS